MNLKDVPFQAKMSEMIKSPTEDMPKENLSSQQWQEFSALLKQRTLFYKEENARMEAVFKKLKILDDVKFLIGSSSALPDMVNTLQEVQTQVLNNNTLTLSHAERLRKHNNYLSKLKISIKVYMTLNERLMKEIKTVRSELVNAKSRVGGILQSSVDEIRQLEDKAKRYEADVAKFERKYPWLKDPEFNLPNITKEIEILKNLKETKNKLTEDLSVYQGLKPDLKEAAQQLAELKEEHKVFMLNSAKV